MSTRPSLLARLRRHWFLVSLLATVTLALLWPAPFAAGATLDLAPLRPACIVVIFLLTGLGLRPAQLGRSLQRWRPLTLLLALNFGAGLAVAWLLARGAEALGLPRVLADGIIILGCLPTTITSCVVLTRLAGGSEPLALAGAVIGNLLGIVLTPLLIVVSTGRHGEVALWPTMQQLALLVALPLAIGMAARTLPIVARWSAGSWRAIVASILILVVLLPILAEAGAHPPGGGLAVAAAIALACGGLLPILLWLSWQVAGKRWSGCDAGERIACTLTAPQKTISLGIPLLALLFHGHPDLGLLSLPLIAYHPVQLALCGWLAGRWGNRSPRPTT